MPLDDLAGDALGGICRFIGRMLVELVLELLIKGVGYGVLGLLRPGREQSDTVAAVVGLLTWIVVILAAVGLWQVLRS